MTLVTMGDHSQHRGIGESFSFGEYCSSHPVRDSSYERQFTALRDLIAEALHHREYRNGSRQPRRALPAWPLCGLCALVNMSVIKVASAP